MSSVATVPGTKQAVTTVDSVQENVDVPNNVLTDLVVKEGRGVLRLVRLVITDPNKDPAVITPHIFIDGKEIRYLRNVGQLNQWYADSQRVVRILYFDSANGVYVIEWIEPLVFNEGFKISIFHLGASNINVSVYCVYEVIRT